MNESIHRGLRLLSLLLALAAPGLLPAAPAADYWHESGARVLPAEAPRPALWRNLSLDFAAVAADLRAAHGSGAATSIMLPEPRGGYSEFRLVDSGVMPPVLQAKYPGIRSFKGVDAQGRRVRLDVSPLGFNAMVFDPAGIWLVRPQTLGDVRRYMVFERSELGVPAGMGSCAVHDAPIDPARLDLVADGQQLLVETGTTQRRYRAAFAANNRYITAVGGGTVAGGLAATVQVVNRVNEVYEHDLSVQLQLVPDNDLLMFPADNSNGPDPFSANNANVIYSATAEIANRIGLSSFDIGHVLTTGSGGVAFVQSLCNNANKGGGTTGLSNPVGDGFYVDYVAHEVGHQFGGNHSFNSSGPDCGDNRYPWTAYEPGSGTSIMAYAGVCGAAENVQLHSDPYFHAVSLAEISAFLNGSGGSCAAASPNDNQPPVIELASLTDGYTIPAQTPFALHGAASDPDPDDVLAYSWEQWDRESQGRLLSAGDTGHNPIFRTWPAAATGTRFFPDRSTILGGPAIKGEIMPTTTRALNFRLTVRDRNDDLHGSGTSQSADVQIQVNSGAGPFTVTAPGAGVIWLDNDSETVTWDVAGTDQPPVSCTAVDIDLSHDGGYNWPQRLASSVPNSGSATVTVPAAETSTARVRVQCSDNIFFNVSPGDFTVEAAQTWHTVGGNVSGLVGSGLMLQLNERALAVVDANGPWQFTVPLADHSAYEVEIIAVPQSPLQSCTLVNASGSIQGADVTDVDVSCTGGGSDVIFADGFDLGDGI